MKIVRFSSGSVLRSEKEIVVANSMSVQRNFSPNLQVHFLQLKQVVPDLALLVDLFVVLAQFLIVKHRLVNVEEEQFKPFVHLVVAILRWFETNELVF